MNYLLEVQGQVGRNTAMKVHDFQERLNFSQGVEVSSAIFDHLLEITPKAVEIRRAAVHEDKHGTDYWIIRDDLPPLSIDIKHRSFCPIMKFNSDDICIETCSIYTGSEPPWKDENRYKIGWTLDKNKRTDFVVFTWPHDKKTRFWILYFPWLCQAANLNWRKWAKQYKERSAINSGYLTLNIFPPREIVAQEMRKLISGSV